MTWNIGLFDDDGNLRDVLPSVEYAMKEKRKLGWGHIHKIKYVKTSKEII